MAKPTVDNSQFFLPQLDKQLLDKLDEQFPERAPQAGETEAEMRVRAGHREVINFMWAQWRLQNEEQEETYTWAAS